jgi:hypothetical protein
MKEAIEKFIAQRPGVSTLITLGTIVVFALAIVAGYRACGDASQQRRANSNINSTRREANTAVNQAVLSEANAANASIERRSEDAVREKTIQPKLEQARRNSATSKTALDEAKRKYNEKTDPQILNPSRADNCLRLQRDFPDTNFEYCAGQ